jgi:hypothetical protein
LRKRSEEMIRPLSEQIVKDSALERDQKCCLGRLPGVSGCVRSDRCKEGELRKGPEHLVWPLHPLRWKVPYRLLLEKGVLERGCKTEPVQNQLEESVHTNTSIRSCQA